MKRMYFAFLRGVAANTWSKLGIVLATTSVVIFVVFESLFFLGIVTNTYIGLITYLALPMLFLIGLVLIPFGLWLYGRSRGMTLFEILSERFEDDALRAKEYGSRLFRTVALLTLTNLIFMGLISASTLHFMEKAKFCGTACHSVMGPEWDTYQQSPHAHVACVECHVGEGFGALVNSKLNGAWQVISASFKLYERPIPTPVHNLRPARETCEKCHWPAFFQGNRVVNYIRYQQDEESTPQYVTLLMKIGSSREGLDQGSHWHIAARNEVRYLALDEAREKILWVEALQPDGSYRRYTNKRYEGRKAADEREIRSMDCVDCHNRATHIYEDAEEAVDAKLRLGLIPLDLPYVKREALGALYGCYPPDSVSALAGIETRIRNFYKNEYPVLDSTRSDDISRVIKNVQAIYQRNIHPEMKIRWGSYPNHLGHRDGAGCFRCHSMDLVDEDGRSVPDDCNLCHTLLTGAGEESLRNLTAVF